MFGFKYHLASLAAVFFALGIGIMIGTAIGEDVLLSQQKAVIEKLAAEQSELRETKKELERNLDFLFQYHQSLYPSQVKGALSEKAISVLYGDSYSDDDQLKAFLEEAGATVSTASYLPEENGNMPDDIDSIMASILTVKEITRDNENSSCLTLEKNSSHPDAVLVMADTGDAKSKEILMRLAYLFKEQEVVFIALQASGEKFLLRTEFKKAGISTIDNVDTVFGQLSLLALLHGRKGHFGVGEGAEEFAILPF